MHCYQYVLKVFAFPLTGVFVNALDIIIEQITPWISCQSPISDYQASFMGRMLYNGFMKGVGGNQKKLDAMPEGAERDEMIKNQQFVMNLIPRNCTRALIQSGGGRMQMNMARAIVEIANGHIIRGMKEAMKKDTPLPCESQDTKQG